MNGTKLIWVVVLTSTNFVAILTTPMLLSSNSQNDNTTRTSGNTIESCQETFTGGYCFYLEEQQTVSSGCLDLYGGKCVKTFWSIPENASRKCFIQICFWKPEKTRRTAVAFSKFFTRDERLLFRNYLTAFCHEMAQARSTSFNQKLSYHWSTMSTKSRKLALNAESYEQE